MKKRLLFIGALTTMIAAIVGSINVYDLWRRKEIKRIQNGSKVLETAQGPIEYCTLGKGPAILIVHGSPGGYDQALAFARLIDNPRFTYIAVSRPGYLRTPLSSGATPEAQADLYAALLDTLSIQQVAALGISGGGPSTLQFALRHPDRCSRLIMISGVAQHYSEQAMLDILPPIQRFFRQIFLKLTTTDPLLHLLLPLTLLIPDGQTSLELLRSTTMYRLRKMGYDNDMQQFAAIELYPLEQITQPALVVHGTADIEVSFEHARLLARKLPHAKLLAIEHGDHMTFYTHALTVMPMLQHFLCSTA